MHLDLTGKSNELFGAFESQGEGETHWQRYAIETIACAMLTESCRWSIATRAALVFCSAVSGELCRLTLCELKLDAMRQGSR